MIKKTSAQISFLGAESALSESVRTRLGRTWAQAFVTKVYPILLRSEERFAPLYPSHTGRPAWSVARKLGILYLQEMFDLDDQTILDAVCFDARYQVALGFEQGEDPWLSRRSYCEFRGRLVGHDPDMELLGVLFEEIRDAGIDDLGTSTTKQRLDSTLICSNIRQMGRVDLLSSTLWTFCRQLLKDCPERAQSLDDAIRIWAYETSEDTWFGGGGSRVELAQLAEWLWTVGLRFARDEHVVGWESYQLVLRAFSEHCEIVESEPDPDGPRGPGGGTKIEVRQHSEADGHTMQSPFDPDAGYGHKGTGYSLHISETFGNEDTEFITGYDLTPANENDFGKSTPMLDTLDQRKPELMLVDGGYANLDAFVEAADRSVRLEGPVTRGNLPPNHIGRDEFPANEDGEIQRCPEGHTPIATTVRKVDGAQQQHAVWPRTTCENCAKYGDGCPVRGKSGKANKLLSLDPKLLLRDRQLSLQKTAAWKELYAARSGIEATNSELKRAHGLGRLRVRRRPRVLMSVITKLTACNVKRWLRAG